MLIRPQGKLSLKKTLGKNGLPVKGVMRKQMPCWPGKQAIQSLYGKNKALAHSADNK
jgi:hypothetical protein